MPKIKIKTCKYFFKKWFFIKKIEKFTIVFKKYLVFYFLFFKKKDNYEK